jgi:hypothetical protein
MDALQAFLEELRHLKVAEHHFLGMLHILIGRRVTREDGTPVSGGMTWRDMAAALKKARWNKESAKKLGVELEKLAPRDRERFWYLVIARAGVDSEKSRQDADKLAKLLRTHGYVVGAAPGEAPKAE